MSKYKNKKACVDGIEFDSRKEAKRYVALKDMEEQGLISDLRLQVKYVLIPVQREPDVKGPRGGITKGKVLERECAYIADFSYFDEQSKELVVEDTKGFRTADYTIKRKLMLHVHGIRIKEL